MAFVARRLTKEPPSRAPRHFAFLSFRWETGLEAARVIQAEFQVRGMASFLDLRHIKTGQVNDGLLQEIERAPNFVVILGPGALDPCQDPADWLRREIAHAIRTERNLVPVLRSGFRFPSKSELPPDLADLPRYNCVDYSPTYLSATIEKLLSFCSITLPDGFLK